MGFIKKLSLPSFLIGAVAGIVLGVFVAGIYANYIINRALSGASTSGTPFAGEIDQARESIVNLNEEKNTLSVYGQVVSIGGGTLVLLVSQTEGKKQFTFTYDDSTVFVYVADDSASTQLPLSSDTITPGTGLNVLTAEAVGSVPNQHAVKVIKI